MTLTDSLAMLPAASVSGLYLHHPQARYFAVGPIGADQAEDYAARMGMPLEEVERWIGPNLAYEPSARRGRRGLSDRPPARLAERAADFGLDVRTI